MRWIWDSSSDVLEMSKSTTHRLLAVLVHERIGFTACPSAPWLGRPAITDPATAVL
ncbi:helix-turn-helix domain-containing protein [Sodalis sp. RH15]|uniref:helix-turn-helix domain-containing protein n=1 Tax=Sodalis sp. RH15 TaxID=3394330 RepID=UPI0039B39858